jgi:hypothetical protein
LNDYHNDCETTRKRQGTTPSDCLTRMRRRRPTGTAWPFKIDTNSKGVDDDWATQIGEAKDWTSQEADRLASPRTALVRQKKSRIVGDD